MKLRIKAVLSYEAVAPRIVYFLERRYWPLWVFVACGTLQHMRAYKSQMLEMKEGVVE